MRNFETDYLISWDFNDKDCPCVNIAVMHIDEKDGTRIVADVLGSSYNKSGVVSLRQLLADYEATRNNVKDGKYYEERLREFCKKKKEEIDEKGEENGNKQF
jgi:hypothetical protein